MGHKPLLFYAPQYLVQSCSAAIKLDDENTIPVVKEIIKSKKLDVYRIYKSYYKDNKKVYEILSKS